MIRLKDNSVSIRGLKPEMVIALIILRGLYDIYALPLVVTSGTEGYSGDGVHKPTSYHYLGYAVDVRKRQVPHELREEFIDKMRRYLKDDFVVVDEPSHYHVQLRGPL